MLYIIIILLVVVLDQVSKAWIISILAMYEVREVVPDFFNLVYVTNKGGAFSLLAGMTSPLRHYFFVGVSSIAIVGMTIACLRLKNVNKFYGWALALIAGGAAGNLIDRLRFGAVTDFLDVYWGHYHWPAFNVADSAITVGVALYIYATYKTPRADESTGEPTGETPDESTD